MTARNMCVRQVPSLGVDRRTWLIAAAIMWLTWGSMAAAQTTLYVDDDTCPGTGAGTPGDPFCKIQDAIDASSPVQVDTILVAPGLYKEAIEFQSGLDGLPRKIRLMSTDGPATTIIDRSLAPSGDKTAVTISSGQGPETVLEGFTVTGGTNAGIDITDSSPTIRGNRITGNTSSVDGGGIFLRQSSAVIADNMITGNQAVENPPDPLSVIKGGGIFIEDSSPVLTRNVIANNTAEAGGGIAFDGEISSNLAIHRCRIEDNIAEDGNGGGILAFGDGTVDVFNCVVSNNVASKDGGGISIRPPFFSRAGGGPNPPCDAVETCSNVLTVTVANSLIVGNTANGTIGGGGIFVGDCADGHISDCTFSCNSTTSGGGAVVAFSSCLNLRNSILWNDSPQEILVDNANADVGFSDVQGGQAAVVLQGFAPTLVYANNINADPLFVDPLGPDGISCTGDECLQLGTGSPAIDAANNCAVLDDAPDLDADMNTGEPLPLDLDHEPRFVDDGAVMDTGIASGPCVLTGGSCTNGDWPVVDMGAYEFQAGSRDCDANTIPDDCDQSCTPSDGRCCVPGCGMITDCNSNLIPDACDICAVDLNSLRGPVHSMCTIDAPLFLSGDDADDVGHCDVAPFCGGLYPAILSFAIEQSGSDGVGIVGIGVNPGQAQSSLEAWNDPVNGGPDATITLILGAAQIATVDFSDYAVIYVPSVAIQVEGGIFQPELDALIARRADIAEFMNSGGGVVALTEVGAVDEFGQPNGFAWLPVAIETTVRSPCNVCPTPALVAFSPDSTCSNMSHTVYHTVFSGPPGFFGLAALAVSQDDPAGEVVLLGTPGCSPDCNSNGVPDECDIADETSEDCNANLIPDECDILTDDCDMNSILDDCQPDCDDNGIADACELLLGAPDCNSNLVPDNCDRDCNDDDIPDACQQPLLLPPSVADTPHDIRKNRFISFDPTCNSLPVAYRVDLLDLACSSTAKKCTFDVDCKICSGGSNDGLACVANSDCPGADKECDSGIWQGAACASDFACRCCIGGAAEGLPCTTETECRVCVCGTEVGNACDSDSDCNRCVGGVYDDQLCVDAPNGGCTGGFCPTDGTCPPGGTCPVEVMCMGCLVSGETCAEQSPPFVLGWVGEPVDFSPSPLTHSPPGTFISRVVTMQCTGPNGGKPCEDDTDCSPGDTCQAAPFFRVWIEDVVHVSDCEIAPAQSYEIIATNNNVDFSPPLRIGTIEQPSNKFWADLVGSFDGTAWSPPNGIVNADDLVAMLAFMNGSSAPHVTVVDLGGRPFAEPRNRIDASDLGFLLRSLFSSQSYPPPFSLHQGGPKTCPGVLPPSGSIGDESTFDLIPSLATVAPGQTVEIDVHISPPFNDISDFAGYELALDVSGGTTGSLTISGDPVVDDTRQDYVFFGTGPTHGAENASTARVINVRESGGTPVLDPAYLASYTYLASNDASGVFTITVRGDGASCLLDSDGFELTSSPHACVAIGISTTPPDCNTNGSADACDIVTGTSDDGNLNGVPDECDPKLFVDASATDPSPDGLTWATAYTELRDALADPSISSVNMIWVAGAGSPYTPDVPAGDRWAIFQLKSSLGIYGGFPPGGGDSTFSARNPSWYETILSGDLNGDDVGGLTDPSRAENSYHVVLADGADASAVLDGFTITGGNANGVGFAGDGGGVFFYDASPTLTNCTISANSATGYGGGLSYNAASSTLTNCRILGNTAGFVGGGMHHTGSLVLTNCVFEGNTGLLGGGLVTFSDPLTVTNCTFTGNDSSLIAGGGLYAGSSPGSITNSVFWNNTGVGTTEEQQLYTSSVVTYTNWQGHVGGVGNIDADPLFADAVNGDLRLLAGSPCIDAADNSAVPSTVSTDVLGIPRFLDELATTDSGAGTGPIVDMGAHEHAGVLFLSLANPPDATIDARQPHLVDDSSLIRRQGIGSRNTFTGYQPEPIRIELSVSGAVDLSAWELCETGIETVESPTSPLAPNSIFSVTEPIPGVYEILLDRPISGGHWSSITYLGDGSSVTWASLPMDVNGNGDVDVTDISNLGGLTPSSGGIHGLYSCDIDHNGACESEDYPAGLDVIFGIETFIYWRGHTLPANTCPGGAQGAMGGGTGGQGITLTSAEAFTEAFAELLSTATLPDAKADAEFDRFITAMIDWAVSRLTLDERRAAADKLQDRSVTFASSKVAQMIPDIVARLLK